ncbi:MAG: FAD-dependent oxidoreductase [Burkholderiales bacterium]
MIIAGAGPVGLTAAYRLSLADIAVTVLEREADLGQDLRASTWHPPTMDMMASLGLATDIIDMGLKARYTQHRDRKSGAIAEFDMDLLRGETDHPYRVQCEQFKVTRLLLERLRAHPRCRVVFGAKVSGIEQTADQVKVLFAHANGDLDTCEGDYAIGADGAASQVRRSLGLEFEGFTYPERFYVVSTDFAFEKVLHRLTEVNYIADPDAWCVLLRVPGLWRCLFPTNGDESDAQVMSDEATNARLQGIFKQELPYQTVHRSLYTVHQRVATRYRVGRVFLAGDSAHINNPLGGMGMNGGLHDAMNLCDKLIALYRGEADESALERYERQRRPIAIQYINANTARNKQQMQERDPEARRRKQEELCRQAEDPVLAKEFLMRSSMIEALRASLAIA